MKLRVKQSLNLASKPFGHHVVVYDLVKKYGDWLFKQPLLLSFQKAGYQIHTARANAFSPIIPVAIDPKKLEYNFALVFTRSDLELVPESLLHKHQLVLEVRREGRFFERVVLWKEAKAIFQKRFYNAHEQERIESIVKFFSLSYVERTIHIKPLQTKRIVVSFAVGENEAQRLSFRIGEIVKVLRYFHQAHYTILYVKKKGAEDCILQRLPPDIVAFLRLIETETIDQAFGVIQRATFYFGSDSGLAHYATQNGSIVFALFSKKYHGILPLFSTNFFNHFAYFGDTGFAEDIIACIQGFSRQKRLYKEAYHYARDFITEPKTLLSNTYANKQKLKWLKLYLVLNSRSYKNQLSKLKDLMNGVFFSDNFYEFAYDKLKPKRDKVFIDSREFSRFLERSMRESFGKDCTGINIFAKNCSFFHGTCLKRKVSDIDNLFISAPNLSKKLQRDALHLVWSALRQYSFSTQLPHQNPRIGGPELIGKKYHPILLQGESVFSMQVHDDVKDVEKYQTRIKVKIILGEFPQEDVVSLRKKMTSERVSWGRRFLREIDDLLEEEEFFEQYGLFIRKIEALLSQVGGFGVNASVILSVNKKNATQLSFVLERLMRHGIIYISGNKLFVNWDLRRPQHRWFVPITLVWKGELSLKHITKGAINANTYAHPPFASLKRLLHGRISFKEILDLLSSESFLVIIEACNALRVRKKQNRQPAFTQKEVQDYVQIPNSNCEEKEDRKICLSGLLTAFSPKLSRRQIRSLSRYNLFVQYLNRSLEAPIHETRFLRRDFSKETDSSMNFTSEFEEDFIRILREYYLYQRCHLPEFFLAEKKKELLFIYFVRGRSLMEGPSDQVQRVREFLVSVRPDFLRDEKSVRSIIERFPRIIQAPSENFLVFYVLKNLQKRKF